MPQNMDETLEFELCDLIIIKDEKKIDGKSTVRSLNGIDLTDVGGDKDFNITSKDFPHICRTCLKTGELIPIFNSSIKQDDSIKVDWLVKECTKIEAVESDGLPENICVICLEKLLKIYAFQKQCYLNESTLKLVLNTAADTEDKQQSSAYFENCESDNALEEQDSPYPSNDDQNHYEEIELLNDGTDNDARDNLANSDEKLNLENRNNDNEVSKLERIIKKSTVKHKKFTQSHYKCKNCEKVYNSFEELKIHRKEANHPIIRKMHTCEVCHRQFTGSKLRQHMRSHTKEKPYKCKFCKQAFTISGNLRRHVMIHTGEKPHVCEVCGKAFIQATTLHTHKKTHNNYESVSSSPYRFICSLCGRGFKRSTAYEKHMRKHDLKMPVSDPVSSSEDKSEAAKPYPCDECNKCFKNRHLLKAHKVTHGEKSFLCSDCGKGFVTKASLLTHLRIHTGEKPHTCMICNKSYSHASTFDTHMLTHTGHRPHACKVCGKTFTQISHVTYHMRTHSGERPYACTYCGKTFALKGNLTVHMRTHTGETPFVCGICGKGFYDSSSRTKHQRSHNRETKAETTNTSCDGKFVIENFEEGNHPKGSVLMESEPYEMPKLEFDTHTGETLFLCGFCGKGFSDNSSRNKHQRSHNSEVKAETSNTSRDGQYDIEKFEVENRPKKSVIMESEHYKMPKLEFDRSLQVL